MYLLACNHKSYLSPSEGALLAKPLGVTGNRLKRSSACFAVIIPEAIAEHGGNFITAQIKMNDLGYEF
jgi:hypothetical protein